jgi:hypothetical protein
MSTESQGPESLEDLCRDRGAPIKLKNDRAQMEIGKTWTSICRKYNIEQCTTEAHTPWQNEAERAIQEVKKMTNTIMDRTGCPNSLWALCSQYMVYLLNRIAHPDLQWRTPYEVCLGVTPDISALLLFKFYERVYFLDADIPFPASKERAGRFVGIAENIGDAFTFWILTEDTDQLIARSVIRTAEDPNKPNLRLDQGKPDPEPPPIQVIGMICFQMLHYLPLTLINSQDILLKLNMQGQCREQRSKSK